MSRAGWLRLDMAFPHSDMTTSRPWPMNSGTREAAQMDRRKKIGSGPRKNCDPAAEMFSKEGRSKPMKPSSQDQIKGKLHELKGKVKEKAGQVANNPSLEAEGQPKNWRASSKRKSASLKRCSRSKSTGIVRRTSDQKAVM